MRKNDKKGNPKIGKQVPSLTSEPTHFRAPSGLFRTLLCYFHAFLCVFFRKNGFEIRFSLVFFHDEKYLRPLKYPKATNEEAEGGIKKQEKVTREEVLDDRNSPNTFASMHLF